MKIKTVLLISFLLFITGVSHAERSIQLSGFGGLGYLHWPPLIPSSVPEEYREKLWEQYKKHFVSQVEKKFAEIEEFGIHLDRMTYHFPGRAAVSYGTAGNWQKNCTGLHFLTEHVSIRYSTFRHMEETGTGLASMTRMNTGWGCSPSENPTTIPVLLSVGSVPTIPEDLR